MTASSAAVARVQHGPFDTASASSRGFLGLGTGGAGKPAVVGATTVVDAPRRDNNFFFFFSH
jgi:hypothetical protein